MFSRVFTRMAAENGAEVAMEEGNERSSEKQVETLEKKAKWNVFNWPDNRSSTALKKKLFRFELSGDSSNHTWESNWDLADHTIKRIKTLVSNHK